VGGGMGRSHGNAQTFPRLADVLGSSHRTSWWTWRRPSITIHRDFGDRAERKHARLKYVIAERGVDWARGEVEKRAGFKLAAPRSYRFTTTGDLYGWHRQSDGRWFLTLFIETGRVKDADNHRLKTALRQIAEKFGTSNSTCRRIRTSFSQTSPMPTKGRSNTFAGRAWREDREPGQRAATPRALACPALPTCGLALAESERMLPGLIDRIEALCAEVGLAGEEIIIRSTGCPERLRAPYTAEIAFVGKAPGRYQVWLGGDTAGTRLNRLWKDMVKDPEIENELRPLLARFANGRNADERFGDWCDRVVLKEAIGDCQTNRLRWGACVFRRPRRSLTKRMAKWTFRHGLHEFSRTAGVEARYLMNSE